MSTLWPTDLDMTDNTSLLEILDQAKEELYDISKGRLELFIDDNESKNGNKLLTVYGINRISKRSALLFKVVHRQGKMFPATIVTIEDDLQDIFKKTYVKQVGGSIVDQAFPPLRNIKVDNEYVCDSPGEFRQKLKVVLALGITRAEIASLLTPSNSSEPQKADSKATSLTAADE